jgi:hypothetical protein
MVRRALYHIPALSPAGVLCQFPQLGLTEAQAAAILTELRRGPLSDTRTLADAYARAGLEVQS